MVGRGDELARVAAVLSGATGERGALVTGPPGMGRTTLLSTASARVATTHRLLRCAPARVERRLAYSGLTDLLSGVDPELFDLLAPPQARALRVAMLAIDPTAPAPDRRAVCYALLAAVRLLSRSGPVLVVVDDLHWLDAPSAAALTYLVRRAQELPVNFLFSADPASTSFTKIAEALGRQGLAELRLGPLDAADLHRLVRERARPNLSAPQSLRLHRDCDGNPGTALDLARSWPRHTSLTAAEERVAALAARGLSNREIGRELFVTEKTVEVHLSHVYRKVGVRSRTALAHRFHTDKR